MYLIAQFININWSIVINVVVLIIYVTNFGKPVIFYYEYH